MLILVKDIALDDVGDLAFRDGDLFEVASDFQHIQHILNASKGHYRRFPLCGASMVEFTHALASKKNAEFMRKRVELQLRLDGFKIKKIDILVANRKLSLSINTERILPQQ